MRASCIILAGGKSSRLPNKPFLLLNKTPLVLHTFNLVKKIFSDIVIVVKNGEQKKKMEKILAKNLKKARIVIDKEEVYSPIAGIKEGAKHLKNNYFFVIPCDMPFIREKTIRELLSRVKDNVDCAAYFLSPSKLEPLCAVYKKNFFNGWDSEGSIYQLIKDAENKALIPIAKEEEFLNINTRKDLKLARKLIARKTW